MGTREAGTVLGSLAVWLGASSLVLVALQDWYVDGNAPGGGSGSARLPFRAIQDAVHAAADGDSIFIAPGTYPENVEILDKDLTLIGTGGRAVTIVDGMASGSVVLVSQSVVALTGLTMTNGSGTPYYGSSYGGGIHTERNGTSTVDLTDCSVVSNSAIVGGGIMAWNGAFTLRNTTVSGNSSAFTGGILSYGFGDLEVIGSRVSSNTSTNGFGGIYFYSYYGSKSVVITNSLVAGNSASYLPAIGGLGFSIFPKTLTLVNSTVVDNLSTSCSVACPSIGTGGRVTVANSILWNSEATAEIVTSDLAVVTHSVVRGGWPGVGNRNADPRFVAPLDGDFRLGKESPAIDAGDNTALPVGLTTDALGLPRIVDDPLTKDTGNWGPPHTRRRPIVDMGAYEFHPLRRGIQVDADRQPAVPSWGRR